MSSDRPIFVVGCPRSGTTLLSLMLHAHPRLAIPPETRFLTRVWRRRHRFGDLSTRKQRRRLARACTNGSRLAHLGLDPGETRRAMLSGPPTIGSYFGTVFAEFARAQGKARWGDKRPIYYQEVDVLLRLFPDAQFVHLMRDGRAAVASLKQMPWWPYDSVAAMATWSHAEWCARRNARRLPPDTYHLVRYEDLVTDPEPVLRELCAFLDEEFDEAMLEPARVRDVVPDGKHWHANLDRDVSTDRVAAWRTQLRTWEIGLMEGVLRRKLARWGYQPSGAGRRPGPVAVGRYAWAASIRRVAVRRRWAAEAKDARAATHPVAAQLTTGQVERALRRGELRRPPGRRPRR